MNIKTKLNNLNSETFIDDYLESCGVIDVDEFKNPTGKYIQKLDVYKNIKAKATKFANTVDWCITYTNKKIAIVCDSDVDGLCSTTITYQMISSVYGTFDHKFLFHSDKTHGLTPEIMEQIKQDKSISIVILPDAGSNDIEQISELIDNKIIVVILDHHQVEQNNVKTLQDPHIIFVNNQLEPQANKNLCGTGVVFKVFQAYDLLFPEQFKNYLHCLDLVAVANIADVMDMRELENVAINKWGLNALYNPFLIALCQKYCKKIQGLTPTDIAWGLAPKLNAVCRSDNQEAKRLVLESFCGIIEEQDFPNTIKAIERCYRKQRESVKELYETLVSTNNPQDSYSNVVIKFCPSTPYTGLVANKLMEFYNKPVLLVHENNGLCTGSCRSPIPIRKQIAEFDKIEFAQGHESAFGVGWRLEDMDKFIEYLGGLELNYNTEQIVTATLSPSKIPSWLFYVTEDYARCWGTNVEEPRFYIPHIRINSTDIKELGNGTTLKFTYCGIEYVKFFATKNDKQSLSIGLKKPLTIDLIGSLGVNRYAGRETLQVKIDKFEVSEEGWENIW